MKVRLRTFARVRELLNGDPKPLDVAQDATVQSVWDSVAKDVAQLSSLRGALRFARNGEIVDPNAKLSDGDELAVLPPSSGG